jgi:cytoskeleton protein RodZ
MSEDGDNTVNEPDGPVETAEPTEPAEPTGPRGGERLGEARRELQISVLEIAKELHLDEAKVRALERNEFDVLGAPVFAKGHLRKYSQLVNVSEEDVFADYYAMTRAAELPPVVSKRPKPRRELTPGPWIAVIVVIVVVATAYWWFSREVVPDSQPVEEAPINSSALAPAATGEIEEAVAAGDDEVAEEQLEPAVEPAAEPETSPPVIEETASPEIAAGQVRVLLTYRGDCWTEITDASGRRLFFDLGRDGRSVELSGAEPLSVLFGSPGNVRVEVNGDDFALPADARPDRPLRLTVSGL